MNKNIGTPDNLAQVKDVAVHLCVNNITNDHTVAMIFETYDGDTACFAIDLGNVEMIGHAIAEKLTEAVNAEKGKGLN